MTFEIFKEGKEEVIFIVTRGSQERSERRGEGAKKMGPGSLLGGGTRTLVSRY